MKVKKNIRILALIAISVSFILSGCTKPDPDVPPVLVSSFQLPAGATLVSIAKLKSRISTSASYVNVIKGDTFICGKVTSTDTTGNIYKYIVVQDTSGGIEVKVDNSTLYTQYKIGQKVYVKCKDLALGNYRSLTQLGFLTRLMSFTEIPDVLRPEYIFKDSLPGNQVEPLVATAFNQLKTKDICKLVKVTNVRFNSAGSLFNNNSNIPTTKIVDSLGTQIDAYISKYASFARDTMPSGKGTITGILTTYDNKFQLVIPTRKDVKF